MEVRIGSGLVEILDPVEAYDTIVEVIDPAEGTLTASQRITGTVPLHGFVGDDHVFSYSQPEAGASRIDVWRIVLHEAARR